MKTIRWLISIAETKPLMFSFAMLLIGMFTMSVVIRERNNKVNECEHSKLEQQIRYEHRLDSIQLGNTLKEDKLNSELKILLNIIIEDYKKQLEKAIKNKE